MMTKTTEDRVSDNETKIAVLSKSCEDCKGQMKDGLKRVEENQERSDKRLWAILAVGLLILGGIAANLLVALAR